MEYSYELDKAVCHIRATFNRGLDEGGCICSRENWDTILRAARIDPNHEGIQNVLARWERLGGIEIVGREDCYIKVLKRIHGEW